MIGKLTGSVSIRGDDSLIIDVAGVGYVLFCSAKNMNPSSLPTSFIVETIVKEDSISLYGFRSEIERSWFNKLRTVKGVGPKMSLAIQSIFEEEEIFQIILSQDKTSLTRVSGVGPRLAERIVTELKNSVSSMQRNLNIPAAKQEKSLTSEDAISALCNLGYARFEAENAVKKILQTDPNQNLSQLIKTSLKELVK